MKTTKLEYFRQEKAESGYAYYVMPEPLKRQNILEFIRRWSNTNKTRVFFYQLSKVEENFNKYSEPREVSIPLGGDGPNSHMIVDVHKVPLCDWVYYLELHYEYNK